MQIFMFVVVSVIEILLFNRKKKQKQKKKQKKKNMATLTGKRFLLHGKTEYRVILIHGYRIYGLRLDGTVSAIERVGPLDGYRIYDKTGEPA